jgi:hypothetical protein
MSTTTVVEVFLGNPLTVGSEEQFLARLRDDLARAGIFARILANLAVGRSGSQNDFFILTDWRHVRVELKTFSGPIVDGPQNGPWTVRVGETDVVERGNPIHQARQATYSLSDDLQRFARRTSRPGPRKDKFFRDFETVVCVFPSVPPGSSIEHDRHVAVEGYDELLARLAQPGPTVPWSRSDWDAYIQDRNLVAESEYSAGAVIRQQGAALINEYLGRYLHEQTDLPEMVATAIQADGRRSERPELGPALINGDAVLLHGASELGKTLWGRSLSAEIARDGHVPVWLAADLCGPSFRDSMARAIVPYTTHTPSELCQAARAAGRSVVFFIDDLTRAPHDVHDALIAGAKAVRLRNPTHGLLMTAKTADAADAILGCRAVELAVPDPAERRALLGGYGAPGIADRCEGFTTPLELALAVRCADELPADATSTQLLDRYVDRQVDGDDRIRGALRELARRMHIELKPSLPRPDAVRALRREFRLDDDQIAAVLGAGLLREGHGQIAFRHERYEHFLAAEELLISADNASVLAATLNSPLHAALRTDAVALESNSDRLTQLLAGCEDVKLLLAAARGKLGAAAAQATDAVLADALTDACAQTSTGAATFAEAGGFYGTWKPSTPVSAASAAQLSVIGVLARDGRFLTGVCQLFDLTDALCSELASTAGTGTADRMFAATYALGPPQLPASFVMQGATQSFLIDDHHWRGHAAGAEQLSQSLDGHGLGVLYLVAHLLHRPDATPSIVEVVERCLAANRYHLMLIGLTLVEDSCHGLEADARRRLADAVNTLPTDNIIVNGSIIDALSALGEVTPIKSLADIHTEIETVFAVEDQDLARRMARGIVSSCMESEVIGPYYEAITELDKTDKQRLFTMALRGTEADAWLADWIVGELGDLSDPETKAAVEKFVARSDPRGWFAVHSGMGAIIEALKLLVRDDVPLPEPTEPEAVGGAWHATQQIMMEAIARAAGRQPESRSAAQAWELLTGPQRAVLASILSNVHQGRSSLNGDGLDVFELVITSMPPAAVDTLVWSLEHLDALQSLGRFDHGLLDTIVELLGRFGDQRAAATLRRFTEQPAVGAAAASAVRAIEARATR